MLSKTIVLSLLASTTFALSADSTLPSFALAGPETAISTVATPTPQAFTTTVPEDDDQPAASRSTQVPASQSFNPSQAPAFTPSSGAIDFTTLPAFPSTPCASTISTASYSRTADLSIGQPLPTTTTAGLFTTPSASEPTPVPSNSGEQGEPCEEDGAAGSVSIVTITASSSKSAPAPSAAPEKGSNEDNKEPTTSASRFSTLIPLPQNTTRSTILRSRPTPNRPAPPTIPTGIDLPHGSEGHPGPGSGRPHPSARYSRYPSLPQLSDAPGSENKESIIGQNFVASTPCTLKTTVRPTPTGL